MKQVEIVTIKEYRAAAATLYESFDGDDISRYLFSHIENLLDQELAQRTYFECIVYSHILKGLVIGIRTDDGLGFESVAVWSLPGSGDMEDFLTYWRSGFYKLSWQVGREGRRKIYNELFDMLYEVEEQILGELGCYTLVYMGTVASGRGKGNVSRLLKYTFENHIDKTGDLGYLECSALSNISMYKKYGFTPVREIHIGSGNLEAKMHIMVRGIGGESWKVLDKIRERYNYVEPSI